MKPESKLKRGFKSLGLVLCWFWAALLVTSYIPRFIPAYPVLVNTDSIEPGVYLVKKELRGLARGDTITFRFIPYTDELKARRGESGHTKRVIGFPGDIVRTLRDGSFEVCNPSLDSCFEAGVALERDRNGLTLTPWLSPAKSYQLSDEEYWVYAPNPRSLDSRYNGPIKKSQIRGKSTPLYLWDN